MMERLETPAVGRLSVHHLLFDADAIRTAFEAPDQPVTREYANEVGHALLAMAREPLPSAHTRIAGLSPSAHHAFVRLHFRLLDRAAGERQVTH